MNKKTNKASHGKGASGEVSWAGAVRDIVVAAINNGQLPVLLFGSVLLLLASKMPPADAALLLHEVIAGMSNYSLLGWTMGVASLGGWAYHTKYLRKEFHAEYERIGREKSLLQNQATGFEFPSSEES